MSCDVFEAFRYATEDLSDQIHEQAMYQSMWLNLIPRGSIKMNAGTRFVNFGIGNTEPVANIGKWKQIALSRDRAGCLQGLGTDNIGVTGVDDFCTNQWQEVDWGETEMEYQPEYWQLKGPLVCRNDLMFSHNIDQFLGTYIRKIRVRAQREWELNYAYNYSRFSRQASATGKFINSWNSAANTLVTETNTPVDATYLQTLTFGKTTPLKKATSLLTQQMLEYVAQELINQGATQPDGEGFITLEDAGPIFSLYIDMQLSQNLLRLNPELRQDYRYGDPATLIARLGARRVIGNFRHWINQREWRFSFTPDPNTPVDGDGDAQGYYTFIQPFVDSASVNSYSPIIATKGKFAAPNKLWRDAQFGSVHVLSTDVLTAEIFSERNAAGGASFPPKNWMGDFDFVTGAYKFAETGCTDDPKEDKGRHFANFGIAPSPNPMGAFQYGWLIFYDRTALAGNAATNVTTVNV